MKNKNKTTTEYTKESSSENKYNYKKKDDYENAEESFKTKIALVVLCALGIGVITCVILIHFLRIKLNLQ